MVAFLFVAGFSVVNAQFHDSKMPLTTQHKTGVDKIFSNVYSGLLNGDVSRITKYIKSDVSLNLKSGISDYFSPSQAYYVLKDFFKKYHLIELKILTTKKTTDFPYASGTAKYKSSGLSGNLQVFYSLKKINGGWTIAQLTMN